MKTPRPEYEVLAELISSGELTRKQAADRASAETGQSANTFLSWLRSSGWAERLKHTRGNAGSNSVHAHKDPDKVKAYAEALAEALSTKRSVRSVAAKYAHRGVNYVYLARKVKRAEASRVEQEAATANDRTIRALAAELATSKPTAEAP